MADVQVMFRTSPETKKQLEQIAVRKSVSVNTIINKAVLLYLVEFMYTPELGESEVFNVFEKK